MNLQIFVESLWTSSCVEEVSTQTLSNVSLGCSWKSRDVTNWSLWLTMTCFVSGAQADGLQRAFWPLCQTAPAARGQQGECWSLLSSVCPWLPFLHFINPWPLTSDPACVSYSFSTINDILNSSFTGDEQFLICCRLTAFSHFIKVLPS